MGSRALEVSMSLIKQIEKVPLVREMQEEWSVKGFGVCLPLQEKQRGKSWLFQRNNSAEKQKLLQLCHSPPGTHFAALILGRDIKCCSGQDSKSCFGGEKKAFRMDKTLELWYQLSCCVCEQWCAAVGLGMSSRHEGLCKTSYKKPRHGINPEGEARRKE